MTNRRRRSASKSTASEIRAAGVVLLREHEGATQVCVLHRPNHQDWSLPKGKIDPGEHVVTAAAREALEETGERVTLGIPLPTQHYRVEGHRKSVRYWAGWVRSGGPGFSPNREVDDLEWLSPKAAEHRLTYPRDIGLMQTAVVAQRTSPLVIQRHTQAVRRAVWGKKKDELRPLASSGRKRALALVPIFSAFGVERIRSSDTVRCQDTVKPFAVVTGRKIEPEHLFSEAGLDPDSAATFARLDELLVDPSAQVLCTHGPVLPSLLKHLAKEIGIKPSAHHVDPALPPGGFIVFHRAFDDSGVLRVLAVERHAP